jgi:hypothetical protein
MPVIAEPEVTTCATGISLLVKAVVFTAGTHDEAVFRYTLFVVEAVMVSVPAAYVTTEPEQNAVPPERLSVNPLPAVGQYPGAAPFAYLAFTANIGAV